MKGLEEGLKREARRVGFSIAGITRPRASAQMARYRDWLRQGYHGGMGYMARPDAVERRADPRSVMPEVRSIVVVAMNYYPGEFPPTSPRQGRISRYAWGADYHDVMMERLEQLAAWIGEHVGRSVAHRLYVDFGPLLERELAQRAGLGWIGKNTNLIHPMLGSYVFLGELLVDVPLEPDAAFQDSRCGSCTACIDACPTGALVSPGVVDARRCISYLTIEHRGPIPEELRPLLGDWVFGCDVCQEVCPWNKRFARPAPASPLEPVRPRLDLIELLTLDECAFRARFRETPLWRPRRAGLLRNAAVVLGNQGSSAAVPALARACQDESSLIAEHAGWALDQLQM